MSIGQFMPGALLRGNKTPLKIDFLGGTYRNTNGNNTVITSIPWGEPDPTRVFIATITNAGNSNARVVSTSFSGVTGIQVVKSPNDFAYSAIHYAHIPTGTSLALTVTFSAATVNQICVGVYKITGDRVAEIFDTASAEADAPANMLLNIPSGGVVVGAARSSTSVTADWEGLDIDYRQILNNSASQMHTGAHRGFEGSRSNYLIKALSTPSGLLRACAASFG